MDPAELGLPAAPLLVYIMKRIFLLIAFLCIPGIAIADSDAGMRLADAARLQIGKTLGYDPAYRSLPYPHGDVPMGTGVCSDVIVRAFRAAIGLDLQQLIHEDMRRSFDKCPDTWGLGSPDRNIDHRRVPNLETYFRRQGWSLPVSRDPKDYEPGDLVTCMVPPHLAHIMIVSTKRTLFGRPLIIHNIGAGTKEEDRLFEFELTGHYRIDLPGRNNAVTRR